MGFHKQVSSNVETSLMFLTRVNLCAYNLGQVEENGTISYELKLLDRQKPFFRVLLTTS